MKDKPMIALGYKLMAFLAPVIIIFFSGVSKTTSPSVSIPKILS